MRHEATDPEEPARAVPAAPRARGHCGVRGARVGAGHRRHPGIQAGVAAQRVPQAFAPHPRGDRVRAGVVSQRPLQLRCGRHRGVAAREPALRRAIAARAGAARGVVLATGRVASPQTCARSGGAKTTACARARCTCRTAQGATAVAAVFSAVISLWGRHYIRVRFPAVPARNMTEPDPIENAFTNVAAKIVEIYRNTPQGIQQAIQNWELNSRLEKVTKGINPTPIQALWDYIQRVGNKKEQNPPLDACFFALRNMYKRIWTREVLSQPNVADNIKRYLNAIDEETYGTSAQSQKWYDYWLTECENVSFEAGDDGSNLYNTDVANALWAFVKSALMTIKTKELDDVADKAAKLSELTAPPPVSFYSLFPPLADSSVESSPESTRPSSAEGGAAASPVEAVDTPARPITGLAGPIAHSTPFTQYGTPMSSDHSSDAPSPGETPSHRLSLFDFSASSTESEQDPNAKRFRSEAAFVDA